MICVQVNKCPTFFQIFIAPNCVLWKTMPLYDISIMGVITLKEALREMHSGSLFSITYYTYSATRKAGGEKKEYDGCRLSRKNTDATEAPVFSTGPKRPNHYGNRTRNIVLPDGRIKKLNVWFITRFNGADLTLY